MSSEVLELRTLTRHFGAFTAVDAVDLQVATGSAHAIIGPNGAGKSTLFRLITGILRPSSGTVHFAGEDVTGRRPHVIARRGLSQSFQITSLFGRLTVIENVQAAIVAQKRRSADIATWFHWSTRPHALELLDRVGLASAASAPTHSLSHGDLRSLEVAVALATGPRMLLLDEPTAGMSPYETERMVELIGQIRREEGLTVLFSEHDMDVVFGISDRVTVMAAGRVIADGPAEAVRANEEVMAVYLGSDE
jgi:branched-chain amino acid transport system ATP-binding protein